MPERRVPVPDVMQAPEPCPRCRNPERLFTPNARRDAYGAVPVYEPAWQCPRCGLLQFVAKDSHAASPLEALAQPVQVDDDGRLWLAPDCGDWGSIVREYELTAVFDLEQDLDRGIPAHPDRLVYVYFPIKDEDLPTLHKLHGIARLGAGLIEQGERVLVHCQMGLNRSALLAGLMLVYQGLSGRDAVARLQERRPGALFNARFARYLEEQPAGGREDISLA